MALGFVHMGDIATIAGSVVVVGQCDWWVGIVLCLGGLVLVLGVEVVMLAGRLSPPEVSSGSSRPTEATQSAHCLRAASRARVSASEGQLERKSCFSRVWENWGFCQATSCANTPSHVSDAV